MTKIIVFDLDGTLALDEHRSHHLRKDPKDWAAYFDECENDVPSLGLAYVYECLWGQLDTRLEIWTGRVDSHRHQTEQWIVKHIFPPDRLRMRGAADRTEDTELKRSWLNEVRAAGDEVIIVFEDRKRVVAMWREEGIVCAQVAPGEF